jgi:hypothetical protein
MSLHRFLDASEFVRNLEPLRAFGGERVGDGLLESLEETRLLIPRMRIRYPDPIARRFWLEGHDQTPRRLRHAIEPEGPRWESAVELSNALHRWNNHTIYGVLPHPLDDLDTRFTEFIQQPKEMVFESWQSMRVDVSNDVENTLFDSHYVNSYYSSWQILLAAEVADAGVYFRINFADEDIARAADKALHDGKSPADRYSLNLAPIHVMRDFAKYEKVLDAVVWYSEESSRALTQILKGQGGGRFRLSEAQAEANMEARICAAQESARRHGVTIDNLIAGCRFLAGRWKCWNDDGRPFVAAAYKEFLAETVQMAKEFGELSFQGVRDRVERPGGSRKPILEKIWPNWAEEEKGRVSMTLKASLKSQNNTDLDNATIDAFVNFLATKGLEAFFWRLNSFEAHAFHGNEFALEGMKSDLQGMAIAVEHVCVALGANETQLYEKFKQLWHDPDVLTLLKRGDVFPLARQERLARDWPALKAKIEALRNERGGKVVADLVMAHRIRGGVHNLLAEDDQFELEALFVALMRAAALTFAEVQTQKGRHPCRE